MKHVRINLYTNDTESHPAGVRGLKPTSLFATKLPTPRRTPQGCVD